MTLRADLTELLARTGILDVDVDGLVKDEHLRLRAYLRVVRVVATSQSHDNDREIVAAILRDPVESLSKTAVVQLVDSIAEKADSPTEFQRWAAGLAPELQLVKVEGTRSFLHRRIRDWAIFLAVRAGRTPTSGELADATYWMQRMLAEESTSLPVLLLLVEYGRARKIRNIAEARARTLMRKL